MPGTISDLGFYDAPTDNSGTFNVTAAGGTTSASAAVAVPLSVPTVTATEATDGSGIDLSWDFDNTSPNNATGFDLEREVGGVDTTIATITDPTTSTYTDTGLTNGTSYT